MRDYARIWQSAEKIVFSNTLSKLSSTNTRIERQFDPGAIRKAKAASSRDISIGGPALAGQAIKAGLVDEIHLFLNPIVVGGGNQALPDDVRVRLDLLEENRFRNGVVHLHYLTKE